MAKKHKNYKPQVRKRTKETTGQLELVDVIYMDREKDAEGKYQVFAACTCGMWRTDPDIRTFGKIGEAAKAHVDETGHQLRKV